MVFLFVWQSLPQNAVAVHFRRRRVLVLVLKICSRALLSKEVSKLWLSLKLCNFPTFPGRKQQGICLVSSVALVSNVYSGPIQTEYIAVYFIYHRFFSSDFKQVCHSIVVQMTPDWLGFALLGGWRGHHWGQEGSQLIALIKKTQSFNLSLDKNWSSTSHELHTGSRALKSDRKLWPPARLPWHIGTRTAQQPNVMLGVPLPHTRHMARLRNFSHRYQTITFCGFFSQSLYIGT